MRFQVYLDAANEWRWRIRAGNDEVIAVSSEGYVNQGDCFHTVDLVKSTNVNTPVEIIVGG